MKKDLLYRLKKKIFIEISIWSRELIFYFCSTSATYLPVVTYFAKAGVAGGRGYVAAAARMGRQGLE